jgi:hypothetical protein
MMNMFEAGAEPNFFTLSLSFSPSRALAIVIFVARIVLTSMKILVLDMTVDFKGLKGLFYLCDYQDYS